MKQFFSLAAISFTVLSLTSTVQADCFNGSGKAGVIRNLDRPWVFTVYVPEKGSTEGHYRVKSFGVNLVGKLECKGSKTYCSTEHGSVSLKKTDRGLEMKFSSDLAVEKREDDETQAASISQREAQIFKLDSAHSDICYDAFFKESKYDDYAKAHGNRVTFPLDKPAERAAVQRRDSPGATPVATPAVERSASVQETE